MSESLKESFDVEPSQITAGINGGAAHELAESPTIVEGESNAKRPNLGPLEVPGGAASEFDDISCKFHKDSINKN